MTDQKKASSQLSEQQPIVITPKQTEQGSKHH